MAKKWEKHTPKGKKLPEHVSKSAALNNVLAAHLEKQGHPLVTGAISLATRFGWPALKWFGGQVAGMFPYVGLSYLMNRGGGGEAPQTGSAPQPGTTPLSSGPMPPMSQPVNPQYNPPNVHSTAQRPRPEFMPFNTQQAMPGLPHSQPAGMSAKIGAAAMNAATRTPAMSSPVPQKKASLGTPFTDGMLMFCIEKGLSGEQVADLMQKGAELEGRQGQECQGLLERMLES